MVSMACNMVYLGVRGRTTIVKIPRPNYTSVRAYSCCFLHTLYCNLHALNARPCSFKHFTQDLQLGWSRYHTRWCPGGS